ncbi:hypothetical protein OQA88_11687 [Cercophora sp. LCS_1]
MEHPTIIPVIAFLIIDRLGKLSTDSGAQSTSTAVSKKRIIDKAQRALLDPSIDQRDLFREFKMLIRTIYLEQRVARLEEAANRQDFLRDIGDWAAAILVRAKKSEGGVKVDQQKLFKDQLEAGGMSGSLANKHKEDCDGWHALQSLDTDVSLPILEQELQLIRDWHIGGQLAGSEPATPYLDRVQALALKLDIPRPLFLDFLRVSDDRNKASHNRPPVPSRIVKQDLVTGSYMVDWEAIKEACVARKTVVESQMRSGKISEQHATLFNHAIDIYLRLHVCGEKDTDSVDDRKAFMELNTEAVNRYAKNEQKTAGKVKPYMVPDLGYTPGKWDDLLLAEEEQGSISALLD